MSRALTCLALALCLASVIGEASAADLANPLAYAPPVVARSLVSEIRGGVFAHALGTREDGSVDLNGEVLFSKPLMPADPLMAFLVPRLHVGATVNTAGDTSQFYAGFTWTYDITPKVFVEGSVGAGFHTGETGRFRVPDRLSLGCSPLIRGSASIGYRFNEQWSIMATAEHISNANLCHDNQGLTNYGVRVGYTF